MGMEWRQRIGGNKSRPRQCGARMLPGNAAVAIGRQREIGGETGGARRRARRCRRIDSSPDPRAATRLSAGGGFVFKCKASVMAGCWHLVHILVCAQQPEQFVS